MVLFLTLGEARIRILVPPSNSVARQLLYCATASHDSDKHPRLSVKSFFRWRGVGTSSLQLERHRNPAMANEHHI